MAFCARLPRHSLLKAPAPSLQSCRLPFSSSVRLALPRNNKRQKQAKDKLKVQLGPDFLIGLGGTRTELLVSGFWFLARGFSIGSCELRFCLVVPAGPTSGGFDCWVFSRQGCWYNSLHYMCGGRRYSLNGRAACVFSIEHKTTRTRASTRNKSKPLVSSTKQHVHMTLRVELSNRFCEGPNRAISRHSGILPCVTLRPPGE